MHDKTCHRRFVRRLAIFALTLGMAPLLAADIIPDSQLQRALRKQNRLIETNPLDATLWNDLGNLLMLGSRHDEAEEAYKRGLEIDRDLVTARYNLALLYQQTGRPGRSKRALLRILRHHPEHAWSHYYLGVALAETGHRKAAIRRFATALRLEPDLTDPEVNPHVLDNDMLADAALHAYSDLNGAQLAPRLYENRERVVRSMVRPNQIEAALTTPDDSEKPMLEIAPEEEPAPTEGPPRRRRGRSDDDSGDGG